MMILISVSNSMENATDERAKNKNVGAKSKHISSAQPFIYAISINFESFSAVPIELIINMGPIGPIQSNGDNTPVNDLPTQDKEHYDQLLKYSNKMTRSLFGKQLFSPADSLLYIDKRTQDRRDFVKNVKAKDQFGDLTGNIDNTSHPLARARSPIAKSSVTAIKQLAIEQKKPVNNVNNSAPELSIVLRDSGKTIAQMRLESTAKSARALIVPWMNSIDKKSHAMDEMLQPEWHPPWKLYRVLTGATGWVHSLAVDPANMWFAGGCGDGLIKIWDLASGKLRITLTGHILGVKGLAVSNRHPYLFSCGEDKMVKCWDLEQNQVVRHYYGHLSGVYCLSLHPIENILITGGRDSVARVWDMRTKDQICCLSGHRDIVGSILCQANDPQIITGSYDTTIRFWDFRMARTLTTLTHHKKSVRALAFKHDKTGFTSGAADNIKQWSLPDGKFVQNLPGHNSIINSLAANKENVLVSGGDNGTLFFWDWRTGYNFQRKLSPVQKGSIESEAGILAMTFDQSGARLITGEPDKTVKMYREDPDATEESHPIEWKPNIFKRSFF